MQALTFALVAPMAAFGSIAVGSQRGSWDRPGRSAVLGLIGCCLGLEREDEAAQEALATDYSVALLCHSAGTLLADYHTIQVPPTRRGRVFATRRAELAAPDLNTVLSRRDYRVGAWHLGALSLRGDTARWLLKELAEAMREPIFTPYLGRRCCPLGLPLAPLVTQAESLAAALLSRYETGPEAPRYRSPDATITLDADLVGQDPRHLRTEIRRDNVRNRKRWQFDLRNEAILGASSL